MATLKRIVDMLEAQRRELQDQLDAVGKAIAALNAAGRPAAEATPAEPDPPADGPASAVLPRRVTPRRMLSDSHKQALVVAKRKAREAHDAAKGLAREMPDDSFVPAIGRRGDRQAPRLVKQPITK
jgi:hypothetical protein